MRPVVCLYTNCQGEALQTLLRQHPALRGHEFVYLKAWLQEQPGDDVLARCEVLVHQASFGTPAFADRLPAGAKCVRIPLITCSFLWPFGFDRPNEPVGWRFPYGDRHLVAQIRQGVEPAQAAADYADMDLAERLDLPRLRDMEVQKWQRYDASTDVAMAAFLQQHMLAQRLFFTPDHPTDFVLLELCNQVLARLGHAAFMPPKWDHHIHTLSGNEVPVHPSLLRHFGITWAAADTIYPLHGGFLSVTARSYYARYAEALKAPTMADGYRAAIEAIARNDDVTALHICNLIRLRIPKQPLAMAAQGLVLALHGQRDKAAAMFRAALPADFDIC